MVAAAYKKTNLIELTKNNITPYRASMIEQEFDQKIAQGMEDIRMGRFTIVNKETNALFIEEMKKELCL